MQKAAKILEAMRSQYGAKKGTSVFYASANSGRITGVHHSPPTPAEEARHKSLAKEVGGKLRTMRFGK